MPTEPSQAFIEAFHRARQMREAERANEAGEPLVWAMIGILLMAVFALALTTHWFPK